MEYRVNLSDLNLESVTTGKRQDFSTVSFAIRNQEPKIKVVSRKYENDGMPGSTENETVRSSATLNLRNADSAAQFKQALLHAIHLCQSTN